MRPHTSSEADVFSISSSSIQSKSSLYIIYTYVQVCVNLDYCSGRRLASLCNKVCTSSVAACLDDWKKLYLSLAIISQSLGISLMIFMFSNSASQPSLSICRLNKPIFIFMIQSSTACVELLRKHAVYINSVTNSHYFTVRLSVLALFSQCCNLLRISCSKNPYLICCIADLALRLCIYVRMCRLLNCI